MEKFVVTFVDGTQCVCYRNDTQISPTPLVNVILSPKEHGDPLLQLRLPNRLWALGVSNPHTDVGPLSTTHLPRCYLNTNSGRDRLRLLAAQAYGRYCRGLKEN